MLIFLLYFLNFSFLTHGAEDENPAPACTFTGGQKTITQEQKDTCEAAVDKDSCYGALANCCPGLKLEMTDLVLSCKEKYNITLTACDPANNHDDCTDNKGCYKQSIDDLDLTPEQEEELNQMQEEQEENSDEEAEWPYENGQTCKINAECDSFNCVQGKCEEKFICRLGQMTETAPEPVKCEEDLVKVSNICSDPLFSTLSNEEIIFDDNLDDFDNACGIKPGKINDDALGTALSSFRSMEWLLSTSHVEGDGDCLRINNFLKDDFAVKMKTTRAEAVKEFSKVWLDIQSDIKSLAEAKYDEEAALSGVQIEPTVIPFKTIFQGMNPPTAQMVVGLNASAVLFYELMENQVFTLLKYEMKMSDIVAKAFTFVNASNEKMQNFDSSSKSWTFLKSEGSVFLTSTIQDKKYESGDVKCRWGKRLKVKRRWQKRYRIAAREKNRDVFTNNPEITTYLDFVEVNPVKTYSKRVTTENKKYFLLDPLMPGNVSGYSTQPQFTNYGRGFLFPNRRRQMNTLADVLITLATPWGDKSGLSKMHFDYALSWPYFLMEHFGGDDVAEKQLIDPEFQFKKNCAKQLMETDLASLMIKRLNILINPSHECYMDLTRMEKLNNMAFGQFMLYSMFEKGTYKSNYFNESHKPRRALFEEWLWNLERLHRYYEKMKRIREQQLICLEKLKTKSHQTLNTNNTNQMIQGGTQYSIQELDAQNRKAGPGNRKDLVMNELKFGGLVQHSSLSAGGLKQNKFGKDKTAFLGDKANLGSASAMLAFRNRKLSESLAFREKSPDLYKKLLESRKEVESSLNKSFSLSNNKNPSIGHRGGNLRGSSSPAEPRSLLDESKTKQTNEKSDNIDSSFEPTNFGFNSSSNSSISGNGYRSSESEANSVRNSSQNMNLIKEIEKNKDDFNPYDGDTLFNVVSKAYMRNLRKVLTYEEEQKKIIPHEGIKVDTKKKPEADLKKVMDSF